uniref:Uncharacterized protein n=1 Tax=Hyaloperonospora arabidopsidis (strain Emoy2) TaxID=559515 RepID=M4B6H2_HYAAE
MKGNRGFPHIGVWQSTIVVLVKVEYAILPIRVEGVSSSQKMLPEAETHGIDNSSQPV